MITLKVQSVHLPRFVSFKCIFNSDYDTWTININMFTILCTANFELFSSSPKDLSVYVSDRYPTREWSNVGQFTARDERDVQSFSLQPQIFGKFIKVELSSHYGSEHFCPISLFRAYGTSEFEVLETETEHLDVDLAKETSANGLYFPEIYNAFIGKIFFSLPKNVESKILYK